MCQLADRRGLDISTAGWKIDSANRGCWTIDEDQFVEIGGDEHFVLDVLCDSALSGHIDECLMIVEGYLCFVYHSTFKICRKMSF